ncbi:MAG: two-component system response regulator [Deltaproteobacteria bacterium]|nr:two-component system response regulator [Deltaproteobacteria bacterium]
MSQQNNERAVVLIVDDTADNITLLTSLLGNLYKNKVATNGPKALQIASKEPPDLVLLDIMMPGMDGYSVCKELKANPATKDVPVIFLTAKAQEDDETHGFELGAVDYITKPISPPILMARVATHLALQQARKSLAKHNEELEAEVEARTRQLAGLQDSLITAMAAMSETRDNETGQHIRRTQLYLHALAEHLKDHPKFKDSLTERTITMIYKSAPLHDIGKVGVPDRILLKPDRLTPEEFEEMKKHTVYGRDTILAAEKELDTPELFLEIACDIAYMHHEKWNGSGYPTGASGDNIPIAARMMAIADVYDALISKRVYKDAMSHEKASSIISEGRGTHFDPDIVDTFLRISDLFDSIAKAHSDHFEHNGQQQ